MSILLLAAAFVLAVYAVFLFGIDEGQRAIYRKHISEALVIEALDRAVPMPFHILNNVTLRSTGSSIPTTQIDHVVVTLQGIFVIETKHYSGQILVNPASPEWHQVLGRREIRFRNPVLQNYGHVRELGRVLNLGSGAFVNLVVFTGRAGLSTPCYPNVLSLADLPRYFGIPRPTILSRCALYDVVGRIEMHRLPRSIETDEYHVQAIKNWLRKAA